MKRLFNVPIAACVLLASFEVLLPPTVAGAQVTVGATWVPSPGTGPSPRAGASMAYDSIHRRSVLFGGSDGSGSYLGDTWEYDGSAWTGVQVAGPPARYLAPMVFDTARGVAVLFGGYNNGVKGDTWEWNGSSWAQKATAHSPPLRLWSAMAYDPIRHVTVLFGGAIDTGLYSDTWQYDGTDWTQVVTAQAPSARRGHSMAFDAARGRTVLFGGQDSSGVDLNDTWEFDGTAWTQVTTASAPPARLFHSMAYDSNLGGTVMLGGESAANVALADTWLYDGGTWQQITSTTVWNPRLWASADYDFNRGSLVLFGGSQDATLRSLYGDTFLLTGQATSSPDWGQANASISPSARVFSQMDYDSARGVSVLFGGSSDAGPGNLADTWTWNGFSWSKQSPAVSPPAVAGAAMAFDSARGVSVLFGGSGANGLSSSTWEWDGANWVQRSFAVSPPAQVWGAMAFDSVRSRIVLFEGDPASGLPAQTWEYDGTAWMQMHPAHSPSARRGPAMAYDPMRGRTVLFGGADSTGRTADTWEWDGGDWNLVPTTSAPSPRQWASLAFDSMRGKVVLFGGDHFQAYDLGESNDTWEWDGAQWIEDWPATAPPIRSGQAVAYDPARGRLVSFGGWNAATSPITVYGDTWELGSGIQTQPGTPGATLFGYGLGLDLGRVNVGSTSNGGAAFLVTSTGTGPLTFNSITKTGSDFFMTTDCPAGGNVLPAGSQCVTVVFFAPTAAGTRTGSITFSYGAAGGDQTFQLQGTGVVIATSLTVHPVTAMFNGAATVSASLQANGSAFAGQPVTLTLPNGGSLTTATDSSGVAIWFGVSFEGVHAGTYPSGLQVSFAGRPGYSPSSASAQLVVTQPISLSYDGVFYVADTSGVSLSATIDQRTPASDGQFIDYASNPVWARFTVTGPSTSTAYYARVGNSSTWSSTGLGTAAVTASSLPDGAYTVSVTLVDATGSSNLSTVVAGDDARVGVASSPAKGGFVSAAGSIASDPSANSGDPHGYFSLQMNPGSTPSGSLVYAYRVRMDVGGGTFRDVDVWVVGTDVTSLKGNSSTAAASGHFNVEYVDAQTGERYAALEFGGGTYRVSVANATNKAPAGFGLVLTRPDGTTFHTTGSTPTAAVVAGEVSCHL